MASAIPPEYRHDIYFLYETFGQLGKEIIDEVYDHCHCDINKASNLLFDMVDKKGNFQSINKTTYGSIPVQDYSKPYNHILEFIKKGYKIMILMRGLPGSGKSTVAVQLLHDSLGAVNRDEFIFSTDDYFRKSGSYVYNAKELEEAHAWNQRRCFSNMKKGVSPIIIDNTNLQIWEMKVYCVMAVKFGYIVEIALPLSNWALNPKILAQKNSHGVDKRKIQEMFDRFQQRITVKDLFREFDLTYSVTMPQYRQYPPLMTSLQQKEVDPTASGSGTWKTPRREYDSPDKKQPQLPIEYVHKFEKKRNDSISTKRQTVDVDELLSVGDESKVKNQKADDLISFINEHHSSPKKEESVNPVPVELLYKHLEENNNMMAKMMALLNQQVETKGQTIASGEETTLLTTETKMEVDHTVNTDIQKMDSQNDSDNLNRQSKNSQMNTLEGLEDLEEENKKLWDLLNKSPAQFVDSKSENKVETMKTSKIQDTNDQVSQSLPEKEKLQTDRLNMFFKKSLAEDPSNSFEFIENVTQPPAEQAAKSTAKNEKSSVPNFDFKAWGLSENALVSWEATSTSYELPVIDDKLISVEKHDQSTNTTEEDFKIARQSNESDVAVTKLTPRDVPINNRKLSNNYTPRKNITLDKGCMTDEEELFLKLNCEESEQVKKLKDIFPNVPLENILDVYEKCDKDFHWTVEIISNSPMNWISFADLQSKSQSKNIEEKKMNKSINFELNDWNVIPPKASNTQEADEEITKKKQEEEEAKQLKKQEEVLQLKKQMEKAVTFPKESYSDHVWQVKNAKMGAMPRATNVSVEKKPEIPELMTVDDDTIYISDDNSDSGSDNGEITEDLVELNLGNELVEQLETMFGRLTHGENFKPIVQMPESLARQLHALYLESICRQIENQSEYIRSQLKEDEEFAMKLQEEERGSVSKNNMSEIMDEALAMTLYRKDVEQWKNLSPDTLALKLTRQKLYDAFPNIEQKLLDEVLVAHNNNYMQTVEAIMNSTDIQSSTTRDSLLEPPISDITLSEMRKQDQFVNKVTDEADSALRSAVSYRDEANKHMQKRRELLQLSQEQYRRRSYEVAMFYRNLAEKELKKAELANQLATHRFIQENAEKLQKGDTLDLHFLYVKDAMVTLDIFIDYQISNLKTAKKPFEHYFVITGRGNRSENGKSKLKPAVIRRLKSRNIHFTSINPGMLRIKLQSSLPMSTDLKKPSSK